MVETGRIDRGGVFYRRPDHRPRLGNADETLWKQVAPLLDAGGLRPPRGRELMAALGLELQPLQGFLDRAADVGLLMKVADNRYFQPSAVIALGEIAETLVSEDLSGAFSAAEFRDRSGISLNLTIRLLEFFDRARFTRRRGDLRANAQPVRQAFPMLSEPHRNSELS